MRIELPFGHQMYSVLLDHPHKVDILEPIHDSNLTVPDIRFAAQAALTEQFNSGKAPFILKPDSKVVILLDNLSFSAIQIKLLEALFDVLRSYSIKPNNILLIPENKSTKPVQKLREKYCCRVFTVHQEGTQFQNLGTTSHGTPVKVATEFIRADFRIAVSAITPNLFYGATGGPCTLLHTICSNITQTKHFQLAVDTHPAPFEPAEPLGNDIVEICNITGLDIVLNVVLRMQNQTVRVIADNPLSAWQDGTKLLRNLSTVKVEHRYDLALVSAGGYPRDSSFFSAIDALYSGKAVTRRGGNIVLLAKCRGSDEIAHLDKNHDLAFQHAKSAFLDDVLSTRQVWLCSSAEEHQNLKLEQKIRFLVAKNEMRLSELLEAVAESASSVAILPAGCETLPLLG